MTLVVDANVAAWAVVPPMAQADALGRFAQWRQEGARLVAPAHWLVEATSAVRQASRLRLITIEETHVAIDALFELQIEPIPVTPSLCHEATNSAVRIQQSRGYDAMCLALAEQLGVDLWTADRPLANAAHQAGADWVHAL